MGLLAIMPWGTALSVVPVAARMSVTEKLVKAKSTMNEIVACGADETACSATRAGANETRKCHACYCAGLQYNTHATDGPGHSAGDLAIDDFSDKEIAEVREQCDAFLQSPGLFETVLVGVAAVAVTIVNSMLKMIIKAISSFERPASFIELQKKVAEKVFVAQFFNTAVSSLVINAALPELVAGIPILSSTVFNGTHRDFDQSWYQQIGGPLMITMLINTVGPIGGNLAAELAGAASRVVAKYTAWTQRELDEAYTGPEFDIATRYGEVLMCVMVTMMYGSGMPMLYAFACFFCWAISYFDRRFLLRACRRPPRSGTSLARLAMTVAPWAAFVHLLFGMWMHTHFFTPSVGATTGAGAGYLGVAADYEDVAANDAGGFRRRFAGRRRFGCYRRDRRERVGGGGGAAVGGVRADTLGDSSTGDADERVPVFVPRRALRGVQGDDGGPGQAVGGDQDVLAVHRVAPVLPRGCRVRGRADVRRRVPRR